MDELDIIKGCVRRDADCEKQLVETYGPFLMSICRRYATQQEDAKDILQESLVNIFKYLKSFNPNKGSFRSWIKTIAINTSLKYLKKIPRNEGYEIIDSIKTIDPAIYQQMATENLMLFVERLPDGYKQIFSLYIIEEYSHKEISKLLGITASTSRSNLTRAKQILRKNILLQSKKEKWMKSE